MGLFIYCLIFIGFFSAYYVIEFAKWRCSLPDATEEIDNEVIEEIHRDEFYTPTPLGDDWTIYNLDQSIIKKCD